MRYTLKYVQHWWCTSNATTNFIETPQYYTFHLFFFSVCRELISLSLSLSRLPVLVFFFGFWFFFFVRHITFCDVWLPMIYVVFIIAVECISLSSVFVCMREKAQRLCFKWKHTHTHTKRDRRTRPAAAAVVAWWRRCDCEHCILRVQLGF